jgi:hypothetical protein
MQLRIEFAAGNACRNGNVDFNDDTMRTIPRYQFVI